MRTEEAVIGGFVKMPGGSVGNLLSLHTSGMIETGPETGLWSSEEDPVAAVQLFRKADGQPGKYQPTDSRTFAKLADLSPEPGAKPIPFGSLSGFALGGFAEAEAAYLSPVGSTTPDPKGGAPTRRYTKDVLNVGHYESRTQGWEVDFTEKDLDAFAANFAKMRANGVDVEVTLDHDQSAESILGYVVDLYREGKTLYALLEMRGERAINLASTVRNVSVEIEDLVDGNGVEYGRSITAVSVVKAPIVPNQSEFIAASRRGKPAILPRLTLSRADVTVDKPDDGLTGNEEPSMKLTIDAAILAAALGLNLSKLDLSKAETSGKNFSDAVAAAFKTQADKIAELEKNPPKATDKPVNMEAIEDRAETVTAELSRLQGKAVRLTEPVIKVLSKVLVGESASRNLTMLSRGGGSGTGPVPAKEVVEALAGSVESKSGEATGSQNLSRGGKVDDKGAPTDADKKEAEETVKRMFSHVGAKPPGT